MRGHSRPKDGVLSHAYDPRIHDAFRRARTLQRTSLLRELMDCRVKPGHDEGKAAPCVLTLILYDIIPNAVRSARARSHEASCGWDRMRRPRPGEDASPAPGRRRELRPTATMSRPPGAWLSGADRPPVRFAQNAKPGREQRTVTAKRGPAQCGRRRDGAP